MQPPMRLALRGFGVRRFWNGHQPAQPQTRQFGHRLRQYSHIVRWHAAFAQLTTDVDLQTHLERRQPRRALLAQTLGNFQPIDAVNPVEGFGHDTGFVALQRANQVPLQRWAHVGQSVDFVQRFLNVVLTKGPLPCGMRRPHRLGRAHFAHRQQAHSVGNTPRTGRSTRQTLAHGLKVLSDTQHDFPSISQPPLAPLCWNAFMDITQLLAFSVKNKASDLHLSAGLPPLIRVHGDVRRINVEPLDHKQVHALIYDIMNDTQRKEYEENLECDFSFEIQGLARFRVNAFHQQRGAAAVLRTIPSKILSLEQLNSPPIFSKIALSPRGVVLVTGPTGSGKSTTMAAILDYLNTNEYGHILTLEDPIEFVHEPKKCLVNQREVGPHTHSFANALKSALREDPDAILVGEMRDLETIRLALTGAETGHLVFGTLHTSSAAKTIDRIVDVFPAEEKAMVRSMLSESLVAIISQTLCKTKDGNGRAAAHEIMVGTPGLRNLIREGKIAQMYSAIQTGQSMGMQTLDQALADLVRRNKISVEEARSKAKFPENFPG